MLMKFNPHDEFFARIPDRFWGSLPKTYVVIGCGGVGSWVGYFLSKLPIYDLILVDDDVVNPSNRARTPFLAIFEGLNKACALKELIRLDRGEKKLNVLAYPQKFDNNLKEMIESEFYKPVFVDCRDTIDHWTDLSPIVGGYDGDSITIEINPKERRHWRSGMEIRYNVPSYVCPPVFIAVMIVSYLVSSKYHIKENKVITVNHILDLLGVRS